VSAFRDVLDADTIARIGEATGDLYERAAALAKRRRGEHAGGSVS
jgi:hypothetical protein